MLYCDPLDVGGIDVVAAGHEHVLLAVHEEQEALGVEVADVAGAQERPARRRLAPQALGGGIGPDNLTIGGSIGKIIIGSGAALGTVSSTLTVNGNLGGVQINGGVLNTNLVVNGKMDTMSIKGTLLGDVTVRDDVKKISVANAEGAAVDSVRGKLRLVKFADPQKLLKEGANLYSANGMAPQADTAARVQQGFVEKSNVNSVVEMSRMISVTRAYTQISALLQQQSDLRRTAIEKLADVPA